MRASVRPSAVTASRGLPDLRLSYPCSNSGKPEFECNPANTGAGGKGGARSRKGALPTARNDAILGRADASSAQEQADRIRQKTNSSGNASREVAVKKL